MMWWAIWCAAAVAAAVAAPAQDALGPLAALDLPQMDSLTADDESLGYAVPSSGRYPGGSPWLYLLADVTRDSQVSRSRRGFSVNPAVEVLQREAYSNYLAHLAHSNRNFLNCIGKRVGRVLMPNERVVKERRKRRMTALSIDLPMAVLREKLALEHSRKEMALRTAANRNFLNDIGKRGFQWNASLDSQKYI